jgi:hypothetical protein
VRGPAGRLLACGCGSGPEQAADRVGGLADLFFPVGNGEALAAAIPAARLLVLDDMGTALRDAAADEVAAAMLAL